MRRKVVIGLALAAGIGAVPQVTQAQNTFRTWEVGSSTTCGERQLGNLVQRFVVEDTGRSINRNYSPTDEEWHQHGCDRRRSDPVPTAESIIAQVEAAQARAESPEHCRELRAEWARMSKAQRTQRYETFTRAGLGMACDLKP